MDIDLFTFAENIHVDLKKGHSFISLTVFTFLLILQKNEKYKFLSIATSNKAGSG